MSDQYEETVKEAFAHFGRAYYFSECLHRELANRLMLSSFQNASDATRESAEEKLARAFTLTMGQLIDQLAPSLPLPLVEKLGEAVKARNYLAHHFWYEHVSLMTSEEGLLGMIDELNALQDQFCDVDSDVQKFFVKQAQSFGITPEVSQSALERVQAGEDDPLPQKRFPKKRERITRVWDAPTGEGRSILIFEADDGELWQLCESGLGWTYREHGSNWQENPEFKPFLPAEISARPRCVAPWEYVIELPRGADFWVKKSNAPRQFRWGIRKRGNQN